MKKLEELVLKGLLKEDAILVWRRKSVGVVHRARVVKQGLIETQDGVLHKTPSGAAKHLNAGKPVDGWLAWRIEQSGRTLSELRESVNR